MFYGGFGVTLGIPVIFRYVGKYMESFRIHYIPQCILYIGSGILCLLIVLELRKMFDTVLADRAFVMENADSLKRIGCLLYTSGDGDLGVSMSEGFAAAARFVEETQETDLGKLLMQTGGVFNEAAPSSLGTIISFAFMGMAKSLKRCV